ncbi:MAG: penicillin acylase family protein, partial [Methylococcales bacterium]|nr:penicillin acylase family protein [Methylococcales bacterium]
PQPWHPLDIISFSRLQTFVMSMGWGGELPRATMLEQLGSDLVAEIDIDYTKTNPVHLQNGIEVGDLKIDPMFAALDGPFLDRTMDGGGRGSNGWVIAPEHTTIGHAILANDMHLPLTNPSLWYILNMKSEDGYQCAGASMPGMPGILVGRNAHISWGITLSYADVEDLYVEKQNPDNPNQILFKGAWETATVVAETIEIKGKPDHVEPVLITRHGPIISSVVGADRALAWQGMPLRANSPFSGFLALNKAKNWDDFVGAIAGIPSPSLNILYADKAGNIGYYVSGKIPVRAQGNGLLPQPGWTGEHEWVGEIPFAEMPHALNPKSGIIVSSNHKIVGDDFPY